MQIRLPPDVAKFYIDAAVLAGMVAEDVIRVVLAIEVLRHQQATDNAQKTPKRRARR